MIGRFPPWWRAGAPLLLAGAILGCGTATPPIAKTPPPPVTVSTPTVRDDVIDYDRYDGRIAVIDKVELRARVRGHLVKVNFEDGKLVKKGQLLYEIDPRPYQAKLDASIAQGKSAEAAVDFAKAEYNRVRQLVSRKAASAEEMDVWIAKQATAKSDLLKAKADEEQAQLDLDYCRITSPIDGKPSRTQVTAGNLINSGGGETLLTTIVSVDPMYVYFDVDERSLLRYRTMPGHGDKRTTGTTLKEMKIPVEVALEGESGYPHKGLLDFADNRVNPATGTIQVRGVLANQTRLLEDGMRARVRIPISDPRKVLLIPERAVGTDQGLKFVYIVNDKNIVERRDVTLDRVVDGMQVVNSGLQPTDRVIINGIQRVRDALEVDPHEASAGGESSSSKQSSK